MQFIPSKHSLSSIMEDYRYALIHLAWHREGNQRTMVFGAVELVPSELPPPEESDEAYLKITKRGTQSYIYVGRFVMTVDAGLQWYEQCRTGTPCLPEPGWLDNGEPKQLFVSNLKEEPAWGATVLGSEFPFQGDVPGGGGVRVHHLMPDSPHENVLKTANNAVAVKWLSDRLYIDLFKFSELLGSVHLLLPNPVLREVRHRLGATSNGNETSDIELIARSGHTVVGLKLVFAEHRPSGMAGYQVIDVTEKYICAEHVGRTEQVSLAVICPNRGLIEWQPPMGFVRTIAINMEMSGATRVVTVPSMPGRAEETYEVRTATSAFQTKIETSEEDAPITTRLLEAQRVRNAALDGEKFGQKWFHGDQDEATRFIRKLVGDAKKQVLIVDPYFANAELFRFALAVRRFEVEVTILTGAEVLRKVVESGRGEESGAVLLAHKQKLSKDVQLKILVMTGEPPFVHDRFLQIDNDVWLSGNSLHSIGERAGMMIRLPDAAPVIKELAVIVGSNERVKTLEQWVEMRAKAKSASGDDQVGDS